MKSEPDAMTTTSTATPHPGASREPAGGGRPMSEAPRDGTTMVQIHDGKAWWPTGWTWCANPCGWMHPDNE